MTCNEFERIFESVCEAVETELASQSAEGATSVLGVGDNFIKTLTPGEVAVAVARYSTEYARRLVRALALELLNLQ